VTAQLNGLRRRLFPECRAYRLGLRAGLRLVGAAGLQLDSLDVQDVSPTGFVGEDADKHRLRLMALEEELDHALNLVADDGVKDHSRTVVDGREP
jgi:hypothetical protein